MRIIAGAHRGTSLVDIGAGDAASHLRPTSDRVRESLFSLLLAHKSPAGSRVLDLFAGTGALGLEALSRGAAHASFVDNGRKSLAILEGNIAKLRREEDCKILRADARNMPRANIPCELVFLDPPYGQNLGGAALLSAVAGGWIAQDAVIIWEESSIQPPPKGFTPLVHRQYGDTHLTLMRKV